jgi:DNA repair protein RecO (recombination protein O)
MTPERATGLILRTRLLTDTSLIVHWLTSEFGRLATVAKGARRPKSPLRGKLDLFYLAEFGFQRSRRSDLHTLREVALRDTHPELRADLARLRQATYCVLLVEQVTEPETPLPAIYTLLTELVDWVCQQPPAPVSLLAFEIRLLDELGLAPNLGGSRLTPAARQTLQDLGSTSFRELAPGSFPRQPLSEAEFFLRRCWLEHLGRLPHGRAEALQLTSTANPAAPQSRLP